MRLLLTLLALITGLSGADRAVAAPATPAAMGSMLLLADAANKAESSDADRRPATAAPTRRTAATGTARPRKVAPPHVPGLLTGSDRALE
ncbi:MAG TPA: hypothetical protein PKD48_07920 [Sphingopyxis sp.]|nr:hypothetical protein [Sphingopyxis sp.]